MHRSAILAAASAALLFSLGSTAADAPATDDGSARVAEQLAAKAEMKPETVRRLPNSPLYEIIIGQRVFYTDEAVNYLLVGRLFDVAQQKDITAERLGQLAVSRWEKLPRQDAVKVVYGKGERSVAVFTDIQCPYCRMLEESLQQAGNVTVYNFIFPILQGSVPLARNVWCSKDPAKAWKDYMFKQIEPEAAPESCAASALDRNLKLGRELEVTGTPAVFFADGRRSAGAMSAEAIDQVLGGKKADPEQK